MANKVVYNNTSYDILDAITLLNKDYLILCDENKLNNITFLESILLDGKRQYFLPPKSFTLEDNPNCNLKRLQASFIISRIVEILKSESFQTSNQIQSKINEIKNFIYTDLTIKSILEDNKNLSVSNFSAISDYLEKYLNKQFITDKQEYIIQQYNYLDRPIKTSEGLDYEWLYDLSLEELRELAGSKNRTSEELIYVLDALDKREKSDAALNNYAEMGRSLTLKKNNNTAAFVDTLLLSLITISFSLLLLLSVF